MDISPLGLVRNTFSTIPLLIKTAFLALLGYSPNAATQDALTEVICVAARPILGTPHALLASQKQFNKDYGVWGRMWISKVTISKTDDAFHNSNAGDVPDVREAVAQVIKKLGDGSTDCDIPKLIDVEAEWTGYRPGVWHTSSRPNLSEREQYEEMMKEVEPGSPTILYLHGGAFCLMDPSTHRWTTSALAKETKGRCFSVRYRLSPQAIFPAALLDAFMAYLYLISPPPGSFHTAVPASEIVIAGDSSGACLATALLLLLVSFSKFGITRVRVHEGDVVLPSPVAAGLALISPWLDLSRSLPSVTENARFDIIAIPTKGSMTPNFPPDAIWPADPPRVETYCEADMISHPLVSPLAAPSSLWKGAPPIYVCVGWEGMQDEAEVFARRVSQAGVVVVFEGFVGMPHCFAMFPWCRLGWRAFHGWSGFCREASRGTLEDKGGYACWINKSGGYRQVPLERLGMDRHELGSPRQDLRDLDDDVVSQLVKESKRWRVEDEKKLRANSNT